MTAPFTTKDAFDSAEEFEEEVKEPNWIKIRLNNIGYKCDQDSLTGEFVKYYNNLDYDTLEEKYANGWEDADGYIRKKNYSISKSLVDKSTPECHFVVAWLRYDEKEYTCDLETVGSRLLDLSSWDREDFFEVYRIADIRMRVNNEE